MVRSHIQSIVLFSVIALLGLLVGAPAQPVKPKPKQSLANELVQNFPTNDAMKTAWKIHWATSTGFGLYIQDAWFKRDPKEPWLQVLGDARLAEMFVPYHSGSPRFWDISYNFALCNVTKDECGPFGKILDTPPTVVHEVRDRGLMWVDSNKGSRRGQKLVLFAILNAANYRYVMEYSFQDDGVIGFRIGSTGRNYGSREFEGHMHNGLWRVDVNLGGPDNNSVLVMEHTEPHGSDKGAARTAHRPFNGGVEGFEDWDPSKFTMISIQNDKKRNSREQPIAYDVMPYKHGNARHYGPDKEECTCHDFWVTKNRKGEIYYQKLPDYVNKGESIMNTDVVVWLSTPGHHEPRSEDGEIKGTSFHGVTPLMWCGFDMKPRNVWDRSPFYP
jgi:primary-amine oxidase